MVVDTEELVDVKELVKRLNLTPSNIYSRIKRGTFPAGIKVGWGRLWLRDEIEDWRRQNSCGI